jgi:transposase InsO family protein
VVGQPRSTQRYNKRPADDEQFLTSRIIELASQYGRYGYRRVTALLRNEGWIVNHKRVERIWRREGLKVPQKQPKRGRLWLNDGSVVRLKPLFSQHVWSYDFMQARTHNGVPFRILNVIDEYSRECLASRVARRFTHQDVLSVLTELFIQRGVPVHIRSDNGAEFTAKNVRSWLSKLQIKPLFIEPGSPWENGYIESFNGKMRDELLNGEIFYTLKEARIIIEMWRKEYNTIRPHSALGYQPPVPEAILIPSTQFQLVALT